MATGPASGGDPPDFRGLSPACLGQLLDLLGIKLVQVMASIKVAEDKGAHTSAKAREHLVRSFVAMGSLVLKAPNLSASEQAGYIARIEKSLRIAMISPASEITTTVGAKIDEAWTEYERVSAKAREKGAWEGDPPHDVLVHTRARFRELISDAADAMDTGVNWDDWCEAVSQMTEAAALATQLRRDVEHATKEGRRDFLDGLRDRRATIIGIAGVVVGVLGIVIGIYIAS
jgi:hypothetical protein